jgi:hypothetical protein
MTTDNENKPFDKIQLVAQPQTVVFVETSDPSITIGVVSDSEPSSLALLAAGVAGMAARSARRSERVKFLQAQTTQT